MTLNSNTTVTSTSNFRHLANALEKRGFARSAGYVVGLGHGAKNRDLTAREVWLQAAKPAVADILDFLIREADIVPEALRRARVHLTYGGTVAEVHAFLPDPFQLVEEEGRITVELTVAQAKAVVRALHDRAVDGVPGLRDPIIAIETALT
jgi:hypothetical protein